VGAGVSLSLAAGRSETPVLHPAVSHFTVSSSYKFSGFGEPGECQACIHATRWRTSSPSSCCTHNFNTGIFNYSYLQ
jgi:hypothetical protein